jgi:hypothetical protein
MLDTHRAQTLRTPMIDSASKINKKEISQATTTITITRYCLMVEFQLFQPNSCTHRYNDINCTCLHNKQVS